MESNMRITIDIHEDCNGLTKTGEVEVVGFRMHFVVDRGHLILNDQEVNDPCQRTVTEALKGLGIPVFRAEPI